jgi:hypothetical protein
MDRSLFLEESPLRYGAPSSMDVKHCNVSFVAWASNDNWLPPDSTLRPIACRRPVGCSCSVYWRNNDIGHCRGNSSCMSIVERHSEVGASSVVVRRGAWLPSKGLRWSWLLYTSEDLRTRRRIVLQDLQSSMISLATSRSLSQTPDEFCISLWVLLAL